MRKLATIRKIEEIKPIPDADKICAYRVDGWWVVDGINKYAVGDLAVYFEIDSWIPDALAPFLSKGKIPRDYNGVKGERLKTVRLRKQLSQGLLMTLADVGIDSEDAISLYQSGEALDEVLNIQKWEAPLIAEGSAKGNWPSNLKHTDQERAQNILHDIFEKHKDTRYEVTIKLDGSSMSVYRYGDDFGVCSRKVNLKLDNEGNHFINMDRKYGITTKLLYSGKPYAIQGEVIGPGIQGNKEGLEEHKFFVFDIWDMEKMEYLSVKERKMFLDEHPFLNLNQAPWIAYNVTLEELGIHNIDDLIEYANGRSAYCDLREGLVFKSMDGQFSWKIISNKFLEKWKE